MERLTIKKLTQLRRDEWNKNHDPIKDRDLVDVIAKKIVTNPSLLKEISDEPTKLIECTFTIVDKDSTSVPFMLNEVQNDFLSKFLTIEHDKEEKRAKGEESEYLMKPIVVLKGRQQGFTSLITAIQLCYAIIKKNFSGMTIADSDSNTTNIFNDKAKFYYQMLPEILHPTEKYSNRRELVFNKLNSTWRIQCATDEIGRSKTLNFVHDSEVAFFKCDIDRMKAAIGQAMTKYSTLIYESTANGYNAFKDLWDSGNCICLFYEWWRTSEYYLKNVNIINEVLEDSRDTWLYNRVEWLRNTKHLKEEQIAWYCAKYRSYTDKNLLKQEYPCTPEEAFISTGECVFNSNDIQERIEELRNVKPKKRGYYTYQRKFTDIGRYSLVNIQWRETPDGYITIMDEPIIEIEKDRQGYETGYKFLTPYTIGGDTAGLGSDYFACKVINNLTRQCVATLHQRNLDDDVYAEQLACLGYYYNMALIGIEANFSYQPNRVLEQLNYPFIYRRTRTDVITHKTEQKIGFVTSKATKPIIIANLITVMRENISYETDIETLKEMLTFIKIGDKKEAQKGCHDDLVMSSAIAHFILDEQGTFEKIRIGQQNKDNFDEFLGEDPNEEYGGYGEWYLPN